MAIRDTSATLIVLQQAPPAGALARTALEAVMAHAAFDRIPAVLFSGAGVLQLAPPPATGTANAHAGRRLIDSLPLYDVYEVYAEQRALERYGVDAGGIPDFISVLDAAGVGDLLRRSRSILSF
jgi:tRNA 2-thiouridine synthesizing protein C